MSGMRRELEVKRRVARTAPRNAAARAGRWSCVLCRTNPSVRAMILVLCTDVLVFQAGISEHAAIYPVDSIKVRPLPYTVRTSSPPSPQTRMQILSPALSASATGAATGASAAPLSLAQHFRLVSSTEGIRSLWRGVASVIMGAGPAHACHFGTYEFVREMTGGANVGVQGAAGTAVAGAAATIASDAFMNPFDGESLVAGR